MLIIATFQNYWNSSGRPPNPCPALSRPPCRFPNIVISIKSRACVSMDSGLRSETLQIPQPWSRWETGDQKLRDLSSSDVKPSNQMVNSPTDKELSEDSQLNGQTAKSKPKIKAEELLKKQKKQQRITCVHIVTHIHRRQRGVIMKR